MKIKVQSESGQVLEQVPRVAVDFPSMEIQLDWTRL